MRPLILKRGSGFVLIRYGHKMDIMNILISRFVSPVSAESPYEIAAFEKCVLENGVAVPGFALCGRVIKRFSYVFIAGNCFCRMLWIVKVIDRLRNQFFSWGNYPFYTQKHGKVS